MIDGDDVGDESFYIEEIIEESEEESDDLDRNIAAPQGRIVAGQH